jgi:predicted negative regulator of RcsB-dependent stress response
MATPLDLEEQEQLDQIKHFWRTYGNLISWLLIVVLATYAAWNGYQYWERTQAAKAAALFDEVERAVVSGDVVRVERTLADMKDKFGSTQFAQQSALLAAKTLHTQGKSEAAREALSWVANGAVDKAYRDIARLRLAALHFDDKAPEEALKILIQDFTPEMKGLAADLRGDVLQAQGQSAQAITAYQQAWASLADTPDYRRLVQAKLNALGIEPDAAAVSETSK